jgi:hypothetical protein
MKFSTKRKVEEIEKKLKLKGGKKLAKVLCIKGQENFDISKLDADVVFMRPYNGRCMLRKELPILNHLKMGLYYVVLDIKN